MARYTGPTAKRWRRIGQVPPDGSGVAVTRRNFPPGQHGMRRGAKLSEYGQQLREKQKAKATYGILERQFVNVYKKSDRKTGVTGENMMRMLEMRLDNVVYRLGFAETRKQARQVVTHGHVRVNDKKVSIPSALVKTGDKISFKEAYAARFKDRDEDSPLPEINIGWLTRQDKELTGTVVTEPERMDMEASINEQLIVEYYSR